MLLWELVVLVISFCEIARSNEDIEADCQDFQKTSVTKNFQSLSDATCNTTIVYNNNVYHNDYTKCDCSENYISNPETICTSKKKTFKLFTDKRLNWYQALESCFNKNMRLATIESEKEFQQVVSVYKEGIGKVKLTHDDDYYNVWLGGSDLAEAGKYVWTSTGRQMTFTRWSPGEPNNNNSENCVNMKISPYILMNNDRCSKLKDYMCEYCL